ncbi:hypothetical protein GO013_07295 [Pseudodesulfovibrio sp. JC047]|uniref:hypothetical protein n=1 Tax=Pseudodesulfovibrio sp. JC047 TaxID=2683199 RepID=UPI0013D1E6D7|nr:hypothetical protein [Pseudodesulfovibrio sp. JC047]NDV19223.1 hypothetical protein [Pseudodesulfovibrio sp. JC047]
MSEETAQVQDTGQEESHWTATLPEGDGWTIANTNEDGTETVIPIREHPSLQKYENPNEAIKALVHAQKQLGKQAHGLVPLGEDASDEDKAAFKSQLRELAGMPESLEDYNSGLNMHDFGEDSLIPKMAEIMFETGAPPQGMQAVLDLVDETRTANMEARKAAYDEAFQASEAALKKEYGVDTLDWHIDRGERVLDAVFTDDAVKLIQESGAGINPHIIKSLNNIADALHIEGGKGPVGGRGGGDMPLSKAELTNMMKDPKYAESDQRDEAFVKKVNDGFRLLAGE